MDTQIPMNMTATQLYDTLRRMQRLEDGSERTNNEIKLVGDSVKTEMPVMRELLNETLTLQKKNEKSENVRRRTIWILGFFISIAIMAAGIIKSFSKKAHKKYLAEGAHTYRR